MTGSLSLESQDFRERAISPRRELGAYEALWSEQGATFKSIAERFRQKPGAIPSDFVPASRIECYADKALAAIQNAGIKHFGIRVHGAGEYPAKLRDADHPIELLYYQGWWDLVNTKCIAIVGTRKPSAEGIRRTKKLAWSLVRDHFTVVSGLARGIDTVAHTTAIEYDGRTIAVLGTPIGQYYPRENKELQQRLADKFLVISQVPLVRYGNQTWRTNRIFFPERNKTMSALTEATIIVEASDTSGTLVQARAAIKQKRKLFILDNCFRNPNLAWPKKFEARGAIRVKDYDDVRGCLDHR